MSHESGLNEWGKWLKQLTKRAVSFAIEKEGNRDGLSEFRQSQIEEINFPYHQKLNLKRFQASVCVL